jgi:serine/threonine protein kinase
MRVPCAVSVTLLLIQVEARGKSNSIQEGVDVSITSNATSDTSSSTLIPDVPGEDSKREALNHKDEGKAPTKPEPKKKDKAEAIGAYKKLSSLGSGVAGVVYEVEKGGKRYALKKAKDRWDQSLKVEYEVLRDLSSEDGFPKPHEFFKCEGRDCLVMELVGPVVSSLQRVLPRFPPETVGSIGIQLIDRIESMHKRGLVHGDLYRNNMSPGRGSNKDKIYAIDFGQVRTNRPKKFDVKSILCTVVGLLKIKENCSHYEDYSRDHGMTEKSPGPVRELTKYVESLSSDSKIDYEKMRGFMARLVKESGHTYKGEIIWPKELEKILD